MVAKRFLTWLCVPLLVLGAVSCNSNSGGGKSLVNWAPAPAFPPRSTASGSRPTTRPIPTCRSTTNRSAAAPA